MAGLAFTTGGGDPAGNADRVRALTGRRQRVDDGESAESDRPGDGRPGPADHPPAAAESAAGNRTGVSHRPSVSYTAHQPSQTAATTTSHRRSGPRRIGVPPGQSAGPSGVVASQRWKWPTNVTGWGQAANALARAAGVPSRSPT